MATLRLGSKIICPIKIKTTKTATLSVIPSSSQQIIVSDPDPYAKILVSGVTASVDNNIISGNIKVGVNILGVTGTCESSKPSIRINKRVDSEGMLTYTTKNEFIQLIGINSIPDYGLYAAYNNVSNLIRDIDLSNITSLGINSLYKAFCGSGITSIDLSSITNIDKEGVLCQAFKDCTNLINARFDSLEFLSGSFAMKQAFENCINLTKLIFPSLQLSAFGINTNQFDDMLKGVTGCIVHFPSELESIIGNWESVLNGFGGTNTIILFDLPAYERDSSIDLVWNSEEGKYKPATNA